MLRFHEFSRMYMVGAKKALFVCMRVTIVIALLLWSEGTFVFFHGYLPTPFPLLRSSPVRTAMPATTTAPAFRVYPTCLVRSVCVSLDGQARSASSASSPVKRVTR